ncbi:MAG: type II toxin-antitoxin system PemK/MazF family toxin [Candidatus Hydrogenedentota bacterium]
MIKQGDIFWVNFGYKRGSSPAYRHPCLVVQNDIFNKSLIKTVVVCLITSNVMLSRAPGNVFLKKGTANLPKDSVVNISQITTVDKSELVEKIGHLSADKFTEVISGINLLISKQEI